MAATIEIKYYNSFWLKKMDSITKVNPASEEGLLSKGIAAIDTIILKVLLISEVDLSMYGPGQLITWKIGINNYQGIITYIRSDATHTYFTLADPLTVEVPEDTELIFGAILNYNFIPGRYTSAVNFLGSFDWYIEEARIRGGYNNTSVDLGVKAYIVEDSPQRQRLTNTLIFSGVFNSRTGVNNTNQFSVADDITRTIDPAQGSIQKLYAEDTNLIIFQELKVSRALIDKDAVYSADGQPMTTSGASVIGQIQSYAGNYGIGIHPESFAVYGYRKYFVDSFQNLVLRLSQDGITEISTYGMFDYFRDNLSNTALNNGNIYGIWDIHSKQYIVSIQPTKTVTIGETQITSIDDENSATLSFDEESAGWTSLHSYIPNYGVSLRNNFYTFKDGQIWKHFSTANPKAHYYGNGYPSTVTVVFNPAVSESKSFLTVNYEGTPNWSLLEFYTDTDVTAPVQENFIALTLNGLQNQLFENRFKKKENKYFANLLNISNKSSAEVLWGQSISGVKGFYANATFYTLNGSANDNNNQKAELFAVSAEYAESSY